MSISQPAMRDPGGAPRSRVIFGDARSMDHVADASVQLVVTSPPYWQLKDYGSDAQLGFAHSYEDYINQLNLVWSECHRALAPRSSASARPSASTIWAPLSGRR